MRLANPFIRRVHVPRRRRARGQQRGLPQPAARPRDRRRDTCPSARRRHLPRPDGVRYSLTRSVGRVVRVVGRERCRPRRENSPRAASFRCSPTNLMSIRLGSQRQLGRPSAVIAGATITDSTVSVISRRHAANRCAGSRSLSISSGPMTSLSPPSPSRARCASSSAVVSSSKVSWLARRPNNPSSPSCRIASSRSALAR